MDLSLDRLSEHRWTLFLLAALLGAVAVLATQAPPRIRAVLAAREEARAGERLVALARDPEATARLDAASAALRRSLLRAGSGEESPRRAALVLHDVETAAGEADVRIVHLQPGARIARAAFDEWTLDLDLRGRFHDLGRFLSAVERPPLRARVLALHLESPDPVRRAHRETPGSPTLAASLRLRLVLQPRSSTPPTTPAASHDE